MKNKTNFLQSCFNKDNLFYTIIFLVNLLIVVISRTINGFDGILWICDVAAILSVLNAIFTAKHTLLGLIFNLAATVCLIITDVVQHIWFNAFICIALSLPSLIIGIIRWKYNENKNKKELNLNKLSNKGLFLVFASYAAISVSFMFLLKALGGNVYVFDAIYSAGCIFGVILSSFAYIDQFKLFFVADLAGLVMYILLTMQNINNLTLASTSVIFIVMQIKGYLSWKKIDNKETK